MLLTTLFVFAGGCNTRYSKSLPRPPEEQKSQQDQGTPQASVNGASGAGMNTASASAVERRSLLVAIAGWNSCANDPRIPGRENPYGMNMNKNFSLLVNQINSEKHLGADWIMGCHGPDPSTIRYVLSDRPQELIESTHEDFYIQITKIAQQKKIPVVILGHSYELI